MKLLLPFLMCGASGGVRGAITVRGAPGVPSVAIPKTTEVLVIQTAKQGVTPQQIM